MGENANGNPDLEMLSEAEASRREIGATYRG